MNHLSKNKKGFTLIELVIYVGLMSVVTMIFAVFMTDIVTHSVRVVQQKEAAENTRVVLAQISQAIKTSNGNLNLVSATELEFTDANGVLNSIYYDATNKSVWLDDGTSQYQLSSSAIVVTDFSFSMLTARTVGINMSVKPNRQMHQEYELSVQTAVVPRQLIY